MAFDRSGMQAEFDRLGYTVEDEADQPGELALRGAVVDVVPADGGLAVRIRLDGEGEGATVAVIDGFDPASQRGGEALDHVIIGPASELVFETAQDRPPGLEHRLPEFVADLASVFDLLPEATLLLDPDADEAMVEALAQIEDARATRVALCRATGTALPPDGLYLDLAAWQAVRAGRRARVLDWPETSTLPPLRGARDPAGAAAAFVEAELARGGRVGLSGQRLARALDLDAAPVASWAALMASPPGTVGVLPGGLPTGFATEAGVVLAAGDVLAPRHGASGHEGLFDIALRPGDAVIHLDYGMARLDGIETVEGVHPADCLVLDFAGDARKLVPCAEMDRVWRYGAGHRRDPRPCRRVELDPQAGVRCWRVWSRRRRRWSPRWRRVPPALRRRSCPPRRAMARFVAGFAYAPTPDQAAAFADIEADLARGRPMDRLLCGDVGFGKTEAALRAAAAVALAGWQVAILAPTTVLVRQHLANFRRRLAAIGVEVAALSRLTSAAEARGIRARLADGSLRVVIGTQALAKDIAFARLALVIVDEEQRFRAPGTRRRWRSCVTACMRWR